MQQWKHFNIIVVRVCRGLFCNKWPQTNRTYVSTIHYTHNAKFATPSAYRAGQVRAHAWQQASIQSRKNSHIASRLLNEKRIKRQDDGYWLLMHRWSSECRNKCKLILFHLRCELWFLQQQHFELFQLFCCNYPLVAVVLQSERRTQQTAIDI